MTVRGDYGAAQIARSRWAAEATLVRARGRARPAVTLAELLGEWLDADHRWRPSTLAGYRSTAGFLIRDPLGARRAVDVTPRVLRAATTVWSAAGCREPTVSGRIRCLRSALGWAYYERILDRHPLDGMRGPPQPGVRLHAPVPTVRALLQYAQHEVRVAEAGVDGTRTGWGRLHRAEQVLLLARLAADSGARRGELAALQVDDLDGDVLTIARGTSGEVIGPTKTGRVRRLTLGPTTAALWHDSVQRWDDRWVELCRDRDGALAGDQRFGPWLFSTGPDHRTRLRTSGAGHWFADLARDAGHPDVTLHRLRHTVATTLVSRGDILGAQYRLGHHDASTTLRIYSHALPMTDADAAATLEQSYR